MPTLPCPHLSAAHRPLARAAAGICAFALAACSSAPPQPAVPQQVPPLTDSTISGPLCDAVFTEVIFGETLQQAAPFTPIPPIDQAPEISPHIHIEQAAPGKPEKNTGKKLSEKPAAKPHKKPEKKAAKKTGQKPGKKPGRTPDKKPSKKPPQPQTPQAPASQSVREHVVLAHGQRTIRAVPDVSLSTPQRLQQRENAFIVVSKKDYYLYVYETQGAHTTLLARYDCALGLHKGNKLRPGDKRTPHSPPGRPFTISQIQDSARWKHDFGDGRGKILAYGPYFLRLDTPGHKGIGIHGSTNNRDSVPGRASEGCLRLKDEDVADLRENYAFVGMKVIIKEEAAGDLPFEAQAMRRQNIARTRNFAPNDTLEDGHVQTAALEKTAVPSAPDETSKKAVRSSAKKHMEKSARQPSPKASKKETKKDGKEKKNEKMAKLVKKERARQ